MLKAMGVIMNKRKCFIGVLVYLLSLSIASFAQLISIKTVPVASGDQFLIFPSQKLGMGNVSIAVDDHLLDPFHNPAKGIRNIKTSLYL